MASGFLTSNFSIGVVDFKLSETDVDETLWKKQSCFIFLLNVNGMFIVN